MSSSDSENDYYGNASKKLQSLLSNYKEDKIDTVNLLKDSISISNIPDKCNITKTLHVNESENIESIVLAGRDDSLDEDDVILDQIIALNTLRQTRSNTKRGTASHKYKTRRGGNRATSFDENIQNSGIGNIEPSFNAIQSVEVRDSPVRGSRRARQRTRGRSRGQARIAGAATSCFPIHITQPESSSRTPRTRRRQINAAQRARSTYATYPCYSVGNTDEYEDFSENVELFNSKPQPEEVFDDVFDDVLDENEEQSVKVYWQSSEIVKFTIRKFQKLSQIFDFFANRENVNPNKLLLTYNDKILKPNDTPDKINYNIAKFIDGGIVDHVPLLIDEGNNVESGIKIKFQCQNVKKPFTLFVQKTEKLKQAMVKCSEHLDKPLNLLKFEFDGDRITGAMTAEDLELEGGECIDVKIVN